MPRYHVAFEAHLIAHIDVDADNPQDAERKARQELVAVNERIAPHLPAVTDSDDRLEFGEEWHHARTDVLENGRATRV